MPSYYVEGSLTISGNTTVEADTQAEAEEMLKQFLSGDSFVITGYGETEIIEFAVEHVEVRTDDDDEDFGIDEDEEGDD